jgi:glycerol-3-phosphate acyltransferase PlsY
MAPMWQLVLLFAAAYCLGSILFGLIISRLKGVDIRKHGSGNAGATNVGRVLGRKWGVLVFVLDVAKGALATAGTTELLRHPTGELAAATSHHDFILLGVGLSCVVGSIAPFYLRFRGGKGVATSLGVILGIHPYLTVPGLASAAVWAAVVLATRYVSLGSVCAACALPITFVLFAWASPWSMTEHYPLLGLTVVMAVLVLLRHRSNMGRLLAGTENRIGGRRADANTER